MNGVHLILDLIWTNSKSKSVLTNGKSYQVSGICLSIRTTNSLLIIRMFLIMIRLGPRNQMQSHRVVLPSVCMKWFHGKSAVGRLITAWSKRSSGNGMDVPLDRNNLGRWIVALWSCLLMRFDLNIDCCWYDSKWHILIKLEQGTMRPVRPHLEVIDFDRIEWMRMGFFLCETGNRMKDSKNSSFKIIQRGCMGIWEIWYELLTLSTQIEALF